MFKSIRSRFWPILAVVFLIHNISYARIHNFQTARLKATAGTGVASLLVEESILLNPSTLTYFDIGALYLQKTGSDITEDQTGLNRAPKEFESSGLAAIVADTTKDLNGALAFIKQKQNGEEKITYASAFSALVGKKSSFGLNYAHVQENFEDFSGAVQSEKYNQIGAGITHTISPTWTVAVSGTDILGAVEKDRRVFFGAQFNYDNLLLLMFDLGTDYKEELNGSSIARAAIQISLLKDVVIRVGAFDDKKLLSNGTGFGLAWIQPKLSFDFALNSYDLKENRRFLQTPQKVRETTFALSYRF